MECQPEHGDECGLGTIHGEASGTQWVPHCGGRSDYTLLMNQSQIGDAQVEVPQDWFQYCGYEGWTELTDIVEGNYLPMLGKKATIVWFNESQRLSKNDITRLVTRFRRTMRNLTPGTQMYVVAKLPVAEPTLLSTVNYNKNLRLAVNKINKNANSGQTTFIPLNNWWLRKGINWERQTQVQPVHVTQSVMYIQQKVLRDGGLADK